jgi:phosphoenolpyruvate synthase/pyruvate phosphate dikinase
MSYTKPFKELNKSNTDIAGGKGASLGEMINSGIPVPNGFVVLADTFEEFIKETDLIQEIDAILDDVDHKAVHTVDEASEKIQGLIKNAEMPQSIADEILSSFETLNAEFVAVRSSATVEDGADHAWAGQLDSYLNITKDNVLEKVQHCWASLFTPRAIFYRFEKELDTTKISVAVVVQKMVNSELSGIAFSVHPVTEDRNQIIIEAGLGLGEAIVSGSITPDSYVVEKEPRKILDINVVEQTRGLFRKSDGGNEWKDLGEEGTKQVLTEDQILELSELIIKIENHYGFPCDIEWAFENNEFFIVQSRPITTLSTSNIDEDIEEKIKKLKKYEWEYSHERVMSYRMMEMFYLGSKEMASEVDCSFNSTLYKVENGNVKFFYDSGELKDVFSKYGKIISDSNNTNFVLDLTEMLKNKYASFDKAIKEFSENFSGISNKELNKIFKRCIETDNGMSYPQWILFFQFEKELTNVLKEKINQKENKDFDTDYIIETLSKPVETTPADQYIIDVLKLNIDELYIKYKHWGCFDVSYEGKDKDFHVEQIKNILESGTKGVDIINKYSEVRKQREKLLASLDLDKHTKSLVDLFTLYADIKEWKNNFRELWTCKIKELYQEIASRNNLKMKNILFYTNEELSELILLNKTISSEIHNKREKDSVFFFEYDNLEIFIDNIEEISILLDPAIGSDVLKGQIAFKGVVTGKVKIINSDKDFYKMKQGDILVTNTTRPSYLPIMQKSGGIITNEGGLLSHAAIVSREMKKPCVIGTKISTQVFKDGDLVEVDAENGIVRKIS